jgi:hypothetical protein
MARQAPPPVAAFRYADPRVADAILPNRTEFDAIVFPQGKAQFDAGVLRLAAAVQGVPTQANPYTERGYTYEGLAKHHLAHSQTDWLIERRTVEPLLYQWLWNTLCTWACKPAAIGQRIVFGGMPGVFVDEPHPATGRVQVTARAYVAIEPHRGEPK